MDQLKLFILVSLSLCFLLERESEKHFELYYYFLVREGWAPQLTVPVKLHEKGDRMAPHIKIRVL